MEMGQRKGLSQNQLKIVASIAMLIDHIGAELLPQILILRIIGRLSFPIFSYFIYEGFQHTRDKRKYFLRIFTLGFLCAIVYYLYSGEVYGNVLITFSISIMVLYGIGLWRKSIPGKIKGLLCGLVFLNGCIVLLWSISNWLYIDYGVLGVLLPVFAELTGTGEDKTDRHLSLLGFSIGLLLLSIYMGGIQYFSLFAVPLLAGYNGQRGNSNLKPFFYWFYPAHLAAIGMIAVVT